MSGASSERLEGSDDAMTPLRKRTIEINEEYWACRKSQTEHVAVAQLTLALAQAEAEVVRLRQRAEKLEAVLNCCHHDWQYVERSGMTWSRCRECGLLERWADGMLCDVSLDEVRTADRKRTG